MKLIVMANRYLNRKQIAEIREAERFTNQIDREVLNVLRNGGRYNMAEIQQRTGLTAYHIKRSIERLRRYVTIIETVSGYYEIPLSHIGWYIFLAVMMFAVEWVMVDAFIDWLDG